MAVRIRLKKMGRKARPFYRICAVDSRAPRDGRVIEELGTYDPMIRETDARVSLKSERVDYWLGVGAQPSHKAGVLIRKYGTAGTHLDSQKDAQERMKTRPAPAETSSPAPKKVEARAEEAAPAEEANTAEETPAEDSKEESSEG